MRPYLRSRSKTHAIAVVCVTPGLPNLKEIKTGGRRGQANEQAYKRLRKRNDYKKEERNKKKQKTKKKTGKKKIG